MKLVIGATVALLLAKMSVSLHRKLRIARGLAPLPGPRGVWLLGNMPAYIKNRDRIYHFLVSTSPGFRRSSHNTDGTDL
jgi:hypothetical protein